MLGRIHIHSMVLAMNGRAADLRSTRTTASTDVENPSGSTTPSAGECDQVRTNVDRVRTKVEESTDAAVVASADGDDGRGGIVWHTQGCGKTMAWHPRLAAMLDNIANKEVDSDGA